MKPCSVSGLCKSLLLVILAPSVSIAAPVDVHVPLLEQLMHEEMAQLQQSEPAEIGTRPRPVPDSRTDLLAMYGVGGRLSIEIRHQGETYRYLAGRKDPLGWRAGSAPLRLRGISGTCVDLEDMHQEPVEACLTTALSGRSKLAVTQGGQGYAGR